MASLELVKTVTDTSVTSLDVTNVFTSSYKKYLIVLQGDITSSNSTIDMRLLDSGGSAISSNYRYGVRSQQNTSQSEQQSTSDTKFERIVYTNNTNGFGGRMFVYNPYESVYTFMSFRSFGVTSSNVNYSAGCGSLDNAASHSGFTIFDATFSTIEVDVYGVKD